MMTAESLKLMDVFMLKAVLGGYGLSCSGSKAVLLKRLLDHVNSDIKRAKDANARAEADDAHPDKKLKTASSASEAVSKPKPAAVKKAASGSSAAAPVLSPWQELNRRLDIAASAPGIAGCMQICGVEEDEERKMRRRRRRRRRRRETILRLLHLVLLEACKYVVLRKMKTRKMKTRKMRRRRRETRRHMLPDSVQRKWPPCALF